MYFVFTSGIRMGNRVDKQVALIEAIDLQEAEAYLDGDFVNESGWQKTKQFSKYTEALYYTHSQATYRGEVVARIIVEGFRNCKQVKQDIYSLG